jgi:CCR4-NOT transcription complex subunit 6
MAESPVLRNRSWVPPLSGDAPAQDEFRVCSWNVLAQVYTRSSWFPWAPSASLKWKTRSGALLRDIAVLSPDVLLLQEVDEVPTFWEQQLAKSGYEFRYKQRTQVTGAKKDGCLIAWRASRLRCVAADEIEHNDLAAAHTPPAGAQAVESGPTGRVAPPTDPWMRMTRDCVGLLLCLQSVASGRRLVVATTHVYWDPALEEVKDAQVSHLLQRAAVFRSQQSTPALLIGGDFNSVPGSEAHQRLLNARAEHGLPQLSSAFALCGAQEPQTTNHTPSFSETLDYLVLGGRGLVARRVLTLPLRSELGEGLPDGDRPSDHLPLVADIVLME